MHALQVLCVLVFAPSSLLDAEVHGPAIWCGALQQYSVPAVTLCWKAWRGCGKAGVLQLDRQQKQCKAVLASAASHQGTKTCEIYC
jgi:hypothetical protein